MSDIYSIDEDPENDGAPAKEETVQPLYRIYEGSRIAISSAVGKALKRRLDAAIIAYEHTNLLWEECFRYYNNDQSRSSVGPKGLFKRGDGTENVVFSNLNIMLPAVYSKNPNITCSTTDNQDEPFCRALQALLNALFRRKDGLNAKAKIKKSAGMALLTNFGIYKLAFTKKGDSREHAIAEMQRMTTDLGTAKTQQEVDTIYGQLEALEQNLEVLEPSGFGLSNILPQNLIIDPFAEQPDGLDAAYMCERVFIPTNSLTARYTKPDDDGDEPDINRVLVYKPTHKARFVTGVQHDDGLGVVMDAIDQSGSTPTSHTEDERTAYINMYFTECYYWWDKLTRRVYLFQRDDWTWPLWVWDDPLQITRFFPYFIISTVMSTGGTVSAGEVSYILDQQDEINDVNRQKSRIRQSIFNFFFYNVDKISKEEAEKFIDSLRGVISNGTNLVGVRAGEMELSKIIEAIAPPAAHYDTLFDTKPILEAINRITNTSDALRGVQFHTNTNVASVKSYEQSMQLSVGAKVDCVEDSVADLAIAIAEIAVQNYDAETVAGYVGNALAQGWEQMDLDTFRATYALEVVAGSMEKPNSAFKKEEAIKVSQALGQFAQAAPGAVLKVMLKVLSQAFPEVVIKPEDWTAIDQEIRANLSKGVSDGSSQGAQSSGSDILEQAKNLPPEVKNKVVQMSEQGVDEKTIANYIMQQLQGASNGRPTEPAH